MLLAGFGSVIVLVVLVILVSALKVVPLTVVVRVMTFEADGLIVPKVQVIIWLLGVQVASDALPYVTLVGNVSVNVIFWAACGPLLATVIV